MKLPLDKFCVLSVNYNTPDLAKDMIRSVRRFWPFLKLVLVDGSDDAGKAQDIKTFCAQDDNILLHQLGYNIHHAPGLIYGLERIKEDYVFLIDTDDIILRKDVFARMFELMDRDTYGVGSVVCVDEKAQRRGVDGFIPYMYPNGMLLNRKMFFRYPMPIVHDGPMIAPMKAIFKEKSCAKRLKHFPGLDEHYIRRGPGTTRIRYAIDEDCYEPWLVNKRDLLDDYWGESERTRIYHGGMQGAQNEIGVDFLELFKQNPLRSMYSLIFTQYDKGSGEARESVCVDRVTVEGWVEMSRQIAKGIMVQTNRSEARKDG